MQDRPTFNFNNKGVPAAYDNVLVPIMFEPWAEALLGHVPPQKTSSLVDVATGTGIVAQKLAERVGSRGSVTATDISAEMLSVARLRCSHPDSVVRFVESPAAPLQLENDVADAVYCQQGFQFFPEKRAAAAEMFRVVRPRGTVVVSTWCPVDRCTYFGAIYDELKRCGEDEVAKTIAIPFNHMPAAELAEHFSSVGFEKIALETHEAALVFPGGVEQASQTVFATPIGSQLKAFSEQKLAAFRDAMVTVLTAMTENGVTSGNMASNVLVARKPG